jgi:hypothetical protein
LACSSEKQFKQIESLVGTSPSMMIAVQTASEADLPLWDRLLSQIPVPKEIREYAVGLKKVTTTQASGVPEENGVSKEESDRQKNSNHRQDRGVDRRW